MSDTIERPSLPDIIAEKLKNAIRNNELKAGDKIPSHQELCKRWGISLTTIRDAITKLESVGILKKVQGSGTFVQEISAERILPKHELGILISSSDTLQLLEVRKALETSIVALAAERRSKEELAELEALLDQMRIALKEEDHQSYAYLDNSFHLLLCKMSKNEFFFRMMESVGGYLFNQHMEVTTRNRVEQKRIARKSQSFHKRILEAIREKDVKKARTSMTEHLQSVERFMRNLFKQKNIEGAIQNE